MDISNLLLLFLVGWVIFGLAVFAFIHSDRIQKSAARLLRSIKNLLPDLRDACFLLTPVLIPIIVCILACLF